MSLCLLHWQADSSPLALTWEALTWVKLLLILRETWCYGVHSSFEGKKVSSQLLRGSLFGVSFSMIQCTLTFCSNETLNTHIVCAFRVAKPTTL